MRVTHDLSVEFVDVVIILDVLRFVGEKGSSIIFNTVMVVSRLGAPA